MSRKTAAATSEATHGGQTNSGVATSPLHSDSSTSVLGSQGGARSETLASLAVTVRQMYHNSALGTALDRRRVIVEWLAKWLAARGRLLVDVSQSLDVGGKAYMIDDGGAVWPLDKDLLLTKLALYNVGINPAEKLYTVIATGLEMEAHNRGKRVKLAHWQHVADDVLYVSCGSRHMVRAIDGELAKVPTGTDGVWFASESSYPEWALASPTHPQNVAAFCPSLETPLEVQSYTPDVQRTLLAAWIAGLLSGLRPLPLLVTIGQKGGGKSMLAKAIMRMLLGHEANVAPLTEDRRDFDTMVTTAPLVGLDNLDSVRAAWLPDALASLATGVNLDKRTLFTDGQKLSKPARAAICITTRTGAFARPDVAERTLPLTTSAFVDSNRQADSDLLAEVDARRDALLTWGTGTASSLLVDRRDAPAGLPLRFVDFARLVWAYMRQQHRPELAASMLQALRQAQSLAVGDADPLIQAITAYSYDLVPQDGVWEGTATDLVRALDRLGAALPHLGGGKRISRHLREAKGTLELFGIRLTERISGNNCLFSLARQEEPPSLWGEETVTQQPEDGESEKAENPGKSPETSCGAVEKSSGFPVSPRAVPPSPEYQGPAIWRNADYDKLVTVTGFAGHDDQGIAYFWIEESDAGIPGPELDTSLFDPFVTASRATPPPTAKP